jgi:hypothetical protein
VAQNARRLPYSGLTHATSRNGNSPYVTVTGFDSKPDQRRARTMTGSFHIDGRRFALDILVGLGLFSLILLAIAGGTSPAGAGEMAVLTLAGTNWQPLALIAAMFSLFMAFNLALYRHVRRVYAEEAPRRRQSAPRSRA